MAYGLSPDPKFQFFDDNGDPVAGGKLFTYAAGSATPLVTYADSAGTANANPVVLDAAGRATVYLSSASYKFILKNAAETVTYWTQDNISNYGLSLLTSTETFTNKTLDNTSTITLKDANFTLQDDAGTTKQFKFQLSGITAGQTRTWTVPDSSDTFVGLAATQTLTNKTLTSPTLTTPTVTTPTITGGSSSAKRTVATYSADGAITLAAGVAKITKGSAAALTLADPAVGDEGMMIVITAQTAHAHTVSNAAGSGFNAGGAASDVATFGGAIGDSFVIIAINAKWNVISLRNVTLA